MDAAGVYSALFRYRLGLMKLRKENERILAARFPEVLRRITASDPSSGLSSVVETEFGLDLARKSGERSTLVYGGRDPKAVGDRWVRSRVIEPETVYAVSGFGSGTHVESLLERAGSGNFVFVGEEDPRTLGEVFSRKDFSAILGEERFLLGTGELDESYFRPLCNLPFPLINQVEPFIFAPLYSLDERYYSRFLKEFARSYEVWLRLFGTNLNDGGLLQTNSLSNLSLLLAAPDIGLLKDRLTDLPVIFVGAGPSLDESIDFLKSAQRRSLIISVNSSFRKLVRNGIRPAITVAADPRPDTAKGFVDLDLGETILVCPFYVDPQVVQLFKGRLLTWTGNNPLIRLVQRRLGMEQGSSILEQGTVSASAFEVGHLWGCRRFCLVGQDMAFTLDGQTHTLDSFYADERRVTKELTGCRMVPGNTIAEVPVDENLLIYLRTFEQIIRDHPEVEVINTSTGGAKVQGVPYLQFCEALEWLGRCDSRGAVTQLGEVVSGHSSSMNSSVESMRGALDPTLNFSRKVYELSLEAALHSELLPSKFEKRSFQQHPKLRAVDSYAEKLNLLLDRHEDDYKVLFDGKTKSELFSYLKTVRALASHSESWERALKNREFFWTLAEGSYFLLSKLRETVGSLPG